MAARKIDNRKSAESESERPGNVIPFVVGPAMADAAGHPLHILAKDRRLTAEVKLSANPTHKSISSALKNWFRDSGCSETEKSSGCETIATEPNDASGHCPNRVKADGFGKSHRIFATRRD